MDKNYMEVVRRVEQYFGEHLPQYTVMEVRRKSYHYAEDDYLYMVSAVKKDGSSFAFWGSYNDRTESLNHGHYGLPSLEVCAQMMTEYQTCGAGYSENSSPLDYLCMLLVKNDDRFENSYQEFLYIRGYTDGIIAQQEHGWDKLTETEVNTLLQKAVEE